MLVEARSRSVATRSYSDFIRIGIKYFMRFDFVALRRYSAQREVNAIIPATLHLEK